MHEALKHSFSASHHIGGKRQSSVLEKMCRPPNYKSTLFFRVHIVSGGGTFVRALTISAINLGARYTIC